MQATIKLVGFEGLEAKLAQVKGATAKNKMRKVLREAGEPIAEKARALAPVADGPRKITMGRGVKKRTITVQAGALLKSIAVSPVLNRSQRRQHGKGYFADLEMHIGPSGLIQGIVQEFGTWFHAAHPFMRPAWDAEANRTLDRIRDGAWAEIEKKARR